MLPTQINYPEFVPDQLLTSEHLNQLFGYLEEQGRLTRTNLIGIGIVCGLEVKANATGTAITITKGCGVTSEGYLVSVPETTYTSKKPFNAVQERIYDRFVDAGKNQRFAIDELKQAAVEEGTVPLTAAALANKVVLIFVEILEEGAKNCNPNSCDDKGINVTVTFRPLLIDKANADALGGNSSNLPKSVLALPELKMRRYDVTATKLPNTAAVFKAYQNVLTAAFLSRTELMLNQTYTTFAPILLDLYPANPFLGLAAGFKFLNDGTIDNEQLINIQYYYDLFSDILLAYDELRKTGTELISICCPDSNLFPRHLFLDLAVPDAAKSNSDYRHYFIPSPILQCNTSVVKELRSLFKRLVLLIQRFNTPPFVIGGNFASKKSKTDKNIRITPSKFGDIALSEKSIPFYYKVIQGPDTLLEQWSFKKSVMNHADKNLSYHAADYNATDEEITEPLLYDLEPYNFLRIEGHLGKPFTLALRNILNLKQQYRLPFEVIALSTDAAALRKDIQGLEGRDAASGLREKFDGKNMPQCQFQDLESLFDTLAAELTCTLCKEMKYFYNLPGNGKLPTPVSTVPKVGLLKKCDPNFRFTAGTFGHEFEEFYADISEAGDYMSSKMLMGNFRNQKDAAGRTVDQSNRFGLMLLYYMDKLSQTIDTSLSEFNISAFEKSAKDLLRIAEFLKGMLQDSDVDRDNGNMPVEDMIDHLDALIYNCKQAQFKALHKDYLSRWTYIMMLQKFGYFLQMHPGIQHKAGVTIGGTFILVYHEDARTRLDELDELEDGRNIAIPVAMVEAAAPAPAVAASPAFADKKTSPQSLREKAKEIENKEIAVNTSKVNSDSEKAFISGEENEVAMYTSDANKLYQKDEILRKVIDGKKLGGSNQLNFIEGGFTRFEEDSDEKLEALIQDIDNGIVIADFYLPYLCYSDCPPVHYIIKDEKEPVDPVTIAIEQKDYCSIDKTAFLIKVTPEGGDVTGEGVKNGKKENPTFSPTGVDMQGSKQKKVILTYTKDGQSATKEVVVYQTPTAKFSATPGTAAAGAFNFKNESDFADTFAWNFGDGNTSAEANPTNTYQKPGSYTVSLVVTNGVCTSAPVTQTVDVKGSTQRDCFPLAEIVKEFAALGKVEPNMFTAFQGIYGPYKDVNAFFAELKVITTQPVSGQLEFFKSKVNPDITGMLGLWLKELERFISNSDVIRTALALQHILVKLTMYIQCIQPEDVGKTEINMNAVFRLIGGQMKELNTLAKNAPTVYNPAVANLLATFKEETARIEAERQGYLKLINAFMTTLSA